MSDSLYIQFAALNAAPRCLSQTYPPVPALDVNIIDPPPITQIRRPLPLSRAVTDRRTIDCSDGCLGMARDVDRWHRQLSATFD